jgi:hypothetical protein
VGNTKGDFHISSLAELLPHAFDKSHLLKVRL